MPPKPKFTKDEIIASGLELVSKMGIDHLTTRNLGEWLGSSARPIFTVFSNMEEVVQAIYKAAAEKFRRYIEDAVNYTPALKEMGLRMIRFSINEPKLFQMIFLTSEKLSEGKHLISALIDKHKEICISVICRDYGFTQEQAEILLRHLWIYTYGISSLCASGMCTFTENEISDLVSTEFLAAAALIKSGNMHKTTPAPVPGNNSFIKANEILAGIIPGFST